MVVTECDGIGGWRAIDLLSSATIDAETAEHDVVESRRGRRIDVRRIGRVFKRIDVSVNTAKRVSRAGDSGCLQGKINREVINVHRRWRNFVKIGKQLADVRLVIV